MSAASSPVTSFPSPSPSPSPTSLGPPLELSSTPSSARSDVSNLSSKNPFLAILLAQRDNLAPSPNLSSPFSACSSGSSYPSSVESKGWTASSPAREDEDDLVIFEGRSVSDDVDLSSVLERVMRDGKLVLAPVGSNRSKRGFDIDDGIAADDDVDEDTSSAWEDELYSSLEDGPFGSTDEPVVTDVSPPVTPVLSVTPASPDTDCTPRARTGTRSQRSGLPPSPSSRDVLAPTPLPQTTRHHAGSPRRRSGPTSPGSRRSSRIASSPSSSTPRRGRRSSLYPSPSSSKGMATLRNSPTGQSSSLVSPDGFAFVPTSPLGSSSHSSLHRRLAGPTSRRPPSSSSKPTSFPRAKSNARRHVEQAIMERTTRRAARLARERAEEGRPLTRTAEGFDAEALDLFFGVTRANAKARNGGYQGVATRGGDRLDVEKDSWSQVDEFKALLDRRQEGDGVNGEAESSSRSSESGTVTADEEEDWNDDVPTEEDWNDDVPTEEDWNDDVPTEEDGGEERDEQEVLHIRLSTALVARRPTTRPTRRTRLRPPPLVLNHSNNSFASLSSFSPDTPLDPPACSPASPCPPSGPRLVTDSVSHVAKDAIRALASPSRVEEDDVEETLASLDPISKEIARRIETFESVGCRADQTGAGERAKQRKLKSKKSVGNRLRDFWGLSTA
ncbi:hypothetical protein JCM10212_001109 [Sporobolomyces blumeae]